MISAAITACGGGSKSGGGADSTAAAKPTAKAQQPNADNQSTKSKLIIIQVISTRR